MFVKNLNQTQVAQQGVTKFPAAAVLNLVTPKAATELKLLFSADPSPQVRVLCIQAFE